LEKGTALNKHRKSNNSRSIYQKCSWKFLADSTGKIKDHDSISGKNPRGTGSGSERLDKEIETRFLAREAEVRGLVNGVKPAESQKEYENRPHLTVKLLTSQPADFNLLRRISQIPSSSVPAPFNMMAFIGASSFTRSVLEFIRFTGRKQRERKYSEGKRP
jgi:hypothetical protein